MSKIAQPEKLGELAESLEAIADRVEVNIDEQDIINDASRALKLVYRIRYGDGDWEPPKTREKVLRHPKLADDGTLIEPVELVEKAYDEPIPDPLRIAGEAVTGHLEVAAALLMDIAGWRKMLRDDGKACVVRYLREVAKQIGGKDDPRRWVTGADAARATGFNRATISRAANTGHITDNGAHGRARRYDGVSVLAWANARAGIDAQQESDSFVLRKLEQAGLNQAR